MRTDVKDVFRLNDEREIIKFCKAYALNNKEFADVLTDRFLPQKDVSIGSELSVIDNDLAMCFKHIKRKNTYNKWDPKLDWHTVSKDLCRLMIKARYMFKNGCIEESTYLALELLRSVGKGYIDDGVYLDQNIDDDFSTNDAVSLLEEVLALSRTTREDKLRIANNLEQIGEMTAYKSYDLCRFDMVIEDIKIDVLDEDDYLVYLNENLKRVDDHSKGEWLIKIFYFFVDHNRIGEAEDWAIANLENLQLLIIYTEWLVDMQRMNDAILILDIRMKNSGDDNWVKSDLQRRMLAIYESQDDVANIIKLCRELFITERGSMVYYAKLKTYVDKNKWVSFLDKLLAVCPFDGNACGALSQIYYNENRYEDLFEVLSSAQKNLLSALEEYAKFLTREQQTSLIVKIDTVLISFAERMMGRNNYKELSKRLNMLKGCCEVGKIHAEKLVSSFKVNYYNRPAMLDELKEL